jgi:hypothetical protein
MKKLMTLFALLFVFALTSAQSDESGSKSATQSTTQKEDVITQPEFKGGIEKMYQYISDNFEYPENAAKRSVNGKMKKC